MLKTAGGTTALGLDCPVDLQFMLRLNDVHSSESKGEIDRRSRKTLHPMAAAMAIKPKKQQMMMLNDVLDDSASSQSGFRTLQEVVFEPLRTTTVWDLKIKSWQVKECSEQWFPLNQQITSFTDGTLSSHDDSESLMELAVRRPPSNNQLVFEVCRVPSKSLLLPLKDRSRAAEKNRLDPQRTFALHMSPLAEVVDGVVSWIHFFPISYAGSMVLDDPSCLRFEVREESQALVRPTLLWTTWPHEFRYSQRFVTNGALVLSFTPSSPGSFQARIQHRETPNSPFVELPGCVLTLFAHPRTVPVCQLFAHNQLLEAGNLLVAQCEDAAVAPVGDREDLIRPVFLLSLLGSPLKFVRTAAQTALNALMRSVRWKQLFLQECEPDDFIKLFRASSWQHFPATKQFVREIIESVARYEMPQNFLITVADTLSLLSTSNDVLDKCIAARGWYSISLNPIIKKLAPRSGSSLRSIIMNSLVSILEMDRSADAVGRAAQKRAYIHTFQALGLMAGSHILSLADPPFATLISKILLSHNSCSLRRHGFATLREFFRLCTLNDLKALPRRGELYDLVLTTLLSSAAPAPFPTHYPAAMVRHFGAVISDAATSSSDLSLLELCSLITSLEIDHAITNLPADHEGRLDELIALLYQEINRELYQGLV